IASWTGSCWLPAHAADLSKIQRTIAKEPVYQKNPPRYFLLVFGPEAKNRMWVVIAGEVLYADRKSNGGVTGPREEFGFKKRVSCVIGDIRDPTDGKVFKNLRVFLDSRSTRVSVEVPGRGYQVAVSDMRGRLEFGANAAAAPVVHLGGPLQLSLEAFHTP